MCKANLQLRTGIKNSTEDQAGNGHSGIGDIADEIAQVVILQAVRADDAVRGGVDEYQRAEAFRGLEERQQGGIVKVAAIDVRADLHGGKTPCFQFSDRSRHVLQWNMSHGKQAPAIVPDDLGEAVVDQGADAFRHLDGFPVGKKRRQDGQHGDVHAALVHVCEAEFGFALAGIPAEFHARAEVEVLAFQLCTIRFRV